jgi:hypothetical protein
MLIIAKVVHVYPNKHADTNCQDSSMALVPLGEVVMFDIPLEGQTFIARVSKEQAEREFLALTERS